MTVRVPVALKERVDVLASEVGISSSAVWKILLHRSLKQLVEGETFRTLDIFRAELGGPPDPSAGEPPGGRRAGPPLFDREGALRPPLPRR